MPTDPDTREALRRALYASMVNETMETRAEIAARTPKVPQHPNSARALVLHRKGTQLGGPNVRYCVKCRNQVAVRGSEYCKAHGGRSVLLARAKRSPAPRFAPRTARRAVNAMLKRQALPRELIDNPLFRSVARIVTPGWFGLPSVPDIPPPVRRQLALLLREMVLAWLSLEDGDHQPWTRAVIRARALL